MEKLGILKGELARIGVDKDGDFDKYHCTAAAVSVEIDEEDPTVVHFDDGCGGEWTGPIDLALEGLRSIPAGDGYEWPAFWDVFREDGVIGEPPTEPYQVYPRIGAVELGE